MTDTTTANSEPSQPLGLALTDQLGPLPEPAQMSFLVDSVMRRYEVRSYTADQMRAYAAAAIHGSQAAQDDAYVCGRNEERERLKALAHSRAGYEATSAAHHAGTWQAAFEMHMTRNAAMCDLIDALFGPNE